MSHCTAVLSFGIPKGPSAVRCFSCFIFSLLWRLGLLAYVVHFQFSFPHPRCPTVVVAVWVLDVISHTLLWRVDFAASGPVNFDTCFE